MTVMIQRLPRNYMLSDVRAEIETVVSSYAYNYIYHPMDTQRGSNSNYAFVNFVNSTWAMRFFSLLSGKSCCDAQRPKYYKISKALLQGVGLNLANYVINYGVMTQNPNEPLVFSSDHQQMEFRLAVNTFCTPGHFRAVSIMLLGKQEGQAAASRPMKGSDWDSKIPNEMLGEKRKG